MKKYLVTVSSILLTFSLFAQDLTQEVLAERLNRIDVIEIETSQWALERSGREDVKAFAEHSIHDHTLNNRVVQSLARGETFDLTGMAEFQDRVDALASLQGAEFDKAYSQLMVDIHKWGIESIDASAQTQNIAESALVAYGLIIRDHGVKMLADAQALVDNSTKSNN